MAKVYAQLDMEWLQGEIERAQEKRSAILPGLLEVKKKVGLDNVPKVENPPLTGNKFDFESKNRQS